MQKYIVTEYQKPGERVERTTLKQVFYLASDVDAFMTAAGLKHWATQANRIAELEKALRFYAEAQDFYLTDKNGNYVDSANDMARTTLALMER